MRYEFAPRMGGFASRRGRSAFADRTTVMEVGMIVVLSVQAMECTFSFLPIFIQGFAFELPSCRRDRPLPAVALLPNLTPMQLLIG